MKKRHPVEVFLIGLMIAGLACQPLPVLANPVGANVVAGNATITGGPGNLVIHQSSHRAIINWNDFSIGVGEITKFVQPSSSAAILNRVIGVNPTKIYGTLEGNGHVYVINENGVVVGRSGVINTRAFLASTLEVNDAAFMNGGALRFSGQSSAGIINAGRISALGGDVFFIARTIENSGRISAKQGTVGLAAGSEVILQPGGSERISVVAGKPGGGTGIDNSGAIQAANAELKAAGGNVYALAINNGGVIRATGFGRDAQGRLVLRAEGGNIHNSGTLAANNQGGGGGTVVVDGGHNEAAPATVINEGEILARGDGQGTEGGTVTMTGDYVGLFGRGLIDVSGHSGGGVALVGGGYQGSDEEVQNALRTIVAPEASIRADALSKGDAGKVVVWSDEITRVYGSLLARGGRGGLIETSSRGSLDLVGAVVNAGVGGLWLLDPGNITIASGGTAITPGMDFVVGAADADATVDAASIVSALNNNTSVKLSAAVDITVDATITKTANPNMTVPTLTLEAGNDILIKEDAIISSTSGRLNIVLNADSDVGGLGNGVGTITLEQATGGGMPPPQPGKVDSNGGTIDLHAANLDIDNDEGTIDSNDSMGVGGLITITASANRNIGVGLDPGTALVIGGGELQKITSAGGLRLVTTGAGLIEVQGISGTESANITGTVTLDSATTVSFVNNASTFNSLAVRAVGGINVNQNLTTDSGSLSLNADSDDNGVGTLTVAMNRTVNSGGQALNITAASLNLDTGSEITSGAGNTTITASDDLAIALGAATVAADFELTGATLQKITTTGTGELRLVTTGNAGVTVDGVTDPQSQNIAGKVLINSDGPIAFSGAASTFNILEAASADGISLGVGVTTSGAQTYSGPVTLAADMTLVGSTVTFNNTVNGTTAGQESLTITGNAVFGDGAGDFVGNTVDLEFVNVSGTARFNAGVAAMTSTVKTAGNQTYGATTLGADTLLTGGTVQFNGAVNGVAADTESLTIAGAAVFGGAVGDSTKLESLNVSGTAQVNGLSIATAQGQSYGAALTLGNDTVLTGSTLSLSASGVSGGGKDLTLNFSGDTTINGGLLSNIDDLSVGGGGNTIINAGTIQTTGGQTYNDNVRLAGDVTLTAGTTVTFTGTLNGTTAGQESLGINGNAVFGNGAGDFVGNVVSLQFLTVSGSTVFNAGNASATVTTADLQTYNGPVTLGADTTLAGSVVSFNNVVDGTSAGQQSLTISGNAVFGGFVGNATALELVNVSGATSFSAGNSGGTANTVATSGTQTYGGTVTLGDDTTLSASTVQFNDTVDGLNPDSERLIIIGNAIFGNGVGDFVGDLVGLRSVSVSGAATFNAGNLGASTVKTSETQTYGSATLNGDTTLLGTTVQFNGDVDGMNAGTDSLLVNGNAVFGGTVDLESVDVTQTATVNGGSITTVLGQTYGSVILGDDTTLSGTTFAAMSGLNGGGNDLNLNFSGDTIIDGAVFGNLGALSVGGGGNTIINGGVIQTVGTQTYDDTVRLSGDVNLTGSTVTFNGTVDGTTAGQEALAVTGNAVFAGRVGGTVLLQDVSVTGSTTFDVNGGGDTVTSAGTQTYGGPVTLSEDTTLNGSTISFNGTVNGAHALAITGNAVFGNGSGDFVGNSAALTSVSVSGTTAFNGGNSGQNTVTTTSVQSYGGAVTLGNDTTLQGTTVTFNDKVNGTSDGQEALTITGNAVFGNGVGDFVGDVTRLEFVNVSGTTLLRAGNSGANTVRTAGNQTYGGAVTLGADTTLAGGGTIQFNDVIEGSLANNESLAIVGNAVFGNSMGDTVGAATPLQSIDVTGAAAINGTIVKTGGAQNYAGPLSVGADATLTASALTFGSTVNAGGRHLTAEGNSIALNGTVTANRLTLTTRDAGFDIGLNDVDDADSMGLSQAELNLITAPVLEIGDANAGDIDILANTTINSSTLVLVTGGRVTGAAGMALTVGNLKIDATGPVSLQGDNMVTTLAGEFDGGLVFRNVAPLTVGTVDGMQGIDSGGDVVLITDTLNIANTITAVDQTVTLQTLTATRGVVLGAEVGTALSLTDQELDRISAGLIRIGSEDQSAASITVSGNITLGANDTLSLRSAGDVTGDSTISVGNLAIRVNGNVLSLTGQNVVNALAIQAPNAAVPIFNNTVSADTTKMIDGIAGVSGVNVTVFNAAAQSQASLSNVEIPLPHRYTVNFESGGVETVPTKVTPGSIWTSYLDVPFPSSDKAERARRVEDASKFMSGSLAILGSTTGPQTGR